MKTHTTWDLKNNVGFRVNVWHANWLDQMEDILEERVEQDMRN